MEMVEVSLISDPGVFISRPSSHGVVVVVVVFN